MNSPAKIARLALDGLVAGETEILDEFSKAAKQTLPGPPVAFDLSSFAAV
jgi:hypothetical protein